jgi:tRNA (guanine37-N1)-methyltransferase
MTMRIDVLTLFPEVLEPYFGTSIVGRAVSSDLVELVCTNYRDFTTDRHRSVDDRPFGGGPGMVMMCGPVFDAVESVRSESLDPTLIMLTPQGERLNQAMAADLAGREHLVLLCGHYEGFDERIRTGLVPREISIGDYVLSGGEAAAIVVVDAIVRLIPGVLGHDESSENDSFSDGLLEYPQYTRPRDFRGMEVPDVLLSGHHAEIDRWRHEQSVRRTRDRRPDLLDAADVTDGDG